MRNRTGAFLLAPILVVLALFLTTGAPLAQSPPNHEVNPFVWKAIGKKWLRDPSVFRTDSGDYILAGSHTYIIEYPDVAPGLFDADDGTPYVPRFFSPNGQRNLRKAGFYAWGKSFFRASRGVVMISSLPTVKDFDTANSEDGKKRSVYVFEPKPDGRTTKGGFPLDWQLRSNTPLLARSYNGDVYDLGDRIFFYSDIRRDKGQRTTCVMVQPMSRDLRLGAPEYLLCPGGKTPTSKDKSGWNRNRPMRSEVRLKFNGGLIEGAWGYRAPSGRHFVFYSAGAYRSDDNYGGFVAVCEKPMASCQKTMRRDGADVRPFINPSSRNYIKVGRPYPVLDADGTLVDVIFHARRRGATENDILRCTNFHPTLIEEFIRGGPGCEYDDIRY